jgi:hypothetical protein
VGPPTTIQPMCGFNRGCRMLPASGETILASKDRVTSRASHPCASPRPLNTAPSATRTALTRAVLLVIAALPAVLPLRVATAQTPPPLGSVSQVNPLDQGYLDLYNLDFAGAHGEFARWMQAHPEDPLGAASDAAAYLFGEFDRLSIIDVQLFADQSRFDRRGKPTPDPAVRKAFEDRADQTNRLADAALAHNPKDANALYAKTLVCGMRSNYALMIDKRDVAALSFSEQASALSRQVLAINPTLYDAYLAAGVENYMLSLKFAPLRWLLSLSGAGTDREEGIRLLRITATQGHYLAPFARMMLAVAAIRDGHAQQARDILTALSKEFPRNSLYIRERDRIH